MRLALDLNFVLLDNRGFAHSVFELARALLRKGGDAEVDVLFYCGVAPRAGEEDILGRLGGRERFRFLPSAEDLPRFLREDRVDILHLHDYFGSRRLFHPEQIREGRLRPSRLVFTVHDVIPLLFPEDNGFLQPPLENLLRLLPSCDAVVVPSDATAAGLRRFWGPSTSAGSTEITAIPWGVDAARFRADRPEAELAGFRNRWGLHLPYVLYVAGGDWRKNHPLLIQAFACFLRSTGLPWELILTGPDTEMYRELVEETPWERSIRFFGFFPEQEIPLLYGAASLFAFPSRYEGFGLPLLEAMAAGVPVVAAEAGSLPEVAGDAALLLPPHDPRAWAEALARLAWSEGERLRWQEKGLRRAAGFTWEATGEAHLALYRRLAAGQDS